MLSAGIWIEALNHFGIMLLAFTEGHCYTSYEEGIVEDILF